MRILFCLFVSPPCLSSQLLLWLNETQSISLEESLFCRSSLVGWVWVFVPVFSFPASLIIHFLSCFLREMKFIILSLQRHQIMASCTDTEQPLSWWAFYFFENIPMACGSSFGESNMDQKEAVVQLVCGADIYKKQQKNKLEKNHIHTSSLH